MHRLPARTEAHETIADTHQMRTLERSLVAVLMLGAASFMASFAYDGWAGTPSDFFVAGAAALILRLASDVHAGNHKDE